MPGSVYHQLTATTPDDPAYEIRPSHFNQSHLVTINATGSEIVNAFSNANGISFGLSAGAITGSYTVPSVPSVTQYFSNTNTTFNGANISGSITHDTNGLQLSLSVAPGGGGADGYNILAAGTQTANTTGTILFQNSNGLTFGMSNSSVITASHNALTTAMASNRGSDFVQATAAFAGTSASGTIASNGISVSIGPYITTAMLSNAATISNIRVSAGTTSNLLSALTFADLNGVSFGINASTVTASHNGLTSQSNQNVTAANGGFAFQTLSFSNLNGISFGTSAGSAITASHNALTTARASNDAIGLNTALTAGPLAWTVNSSGLSLNAGSAAGTTSGFAGNLISGSMTHNTAGLNVSLNHPAWLTTARGSTDAIGLNTAQTNVTWTVNSSGLSLNAAGYAGTGTSATNASITLNSNGLAISVGAGGGVTPVASASNGSFSFTTLAFSNANNVTFGTSAGNIITASVAAPGAAAENNWVNLLGANTAGNTTASGSTIGYSGINLTMSGTNGSVVNISAPATSSLVGTNGVSISTNGSTISVFVKPINPYYPYFPASTVSQTQGAIGVSTASMWAFPMILHQAVAFNAIQRHWSASLATTTVAASQTITRQFGLYTLNSTNLSLISSSSYSMALSQSSISGTLSYPTATSTSGYGYGTTTWAATANAQSLVGTVGQRIDRLQFGGDLTLAPGLYWHVEHQRQSTVGAAAGLSTALVANVMYPWNNVAPIGSSSGGLTTNASIGVRPFGVFTSTNSAGHSGMALLGALPLSGFANTISNMGLIGMVST